MNRVKKMIHLEYAYKLGLTGEGVTVAVMDTGIARHPDFDHRIVGFLDFCNKRTTAYDDNGHGTHVAGIISAENNSEGIVGVAFNCKVMSLKAGNSSGYFNNSDIAEVP